MIERPMRFGRCLGAVVAAGALSAGATGVAQISAQQGASLAGSVIDAASGRPLSGVRVRLSGPSGRSSRGGGAPEAVTDSGGQFVLRQIPAGTYPIDVTKAGYIRDLAAQAERISLNANEVRTALILRLWPSAGIVGQVVSTDGTPIRDANVTAMPVTAVCGRDRVWTGFTVRSDERGHYQIDGLMRGRYLVAASASQGAGAAERFTIYSLDAMSPLTARSIAVGPGQVVSGVDVIMPVRGVAVAGRIEGPAEAGDLSELTIELNEPSLQVPTAVPIARVRADSAGVFRYSRVPPGRYRIRTVKAPKPAPGAVRQSGAGSFLAPSGTLRSGRQLPLPREDQTWWAESIVDVDDQNVQVTLELKSGYRIRGRVQMSSAGKPDGMPSLQSMPILVFPADGSSTVELPATRATDDGRFQTAALPPGRYNISIVSGFAGDGSISTRGIRVADRDATGQAIEVVHGDVGDVVLELTDRAPVILGQVEGSDDLSKFGARVYAFPTDTGRWTECGPHSSNFWSAAASPQGLYRITGLPPSEYFVAAVIGGETDWMRPEYLSGLVAGAKRIRLELGQTASLNLKPRAR